VHRGHHEHQRQTTGGAATPLTVDVGLADALGAVEGPVVAYLDLPSGQSRQVLGMALDQLDEPTSQSDDFVSRNVSSVIRRTGLPTPVVGARSDHPMAEEVDRVEFPAQVAVVRGAKDELTAGDPAARAALHDAVDGRRDVRASLAAAGPPPGDPDDEGGDR